MIEKLCNTDYLFGILADTPYCGMAIKVSSSLTFDAESVSNNNKYSCGSFSCSACTINDNYTLTVYGELIAIWGTTNDS